MLMQNVGKHKFALQLFWKNIKYNGLYKFSKKQLSHTTKRVLCNFKSMIPWRFLEIAKKDFFCDESCSCPLSYVDGRFETKPVLGKISFIYIKFTIAQTSCHLVLGIGRSKNIVITLKTTRTGCVHTTCFEMQGLSTNSATILKSNKL